MSSVSILDEVKVVKTYPKDHSAPRLPIKRNLTKKEETTRMVSSL